MKKQILKWVVLCFPLLLTGGCDNFSGSADREPLPLEQRLYQDYRGTLEVILVRGHPTRDEVDVAVEAFRRALEKDLSETARYRRKEVKRYQDARMFARRRVEEEILSQLRESRDLGGWRIVEGAIRAFWVLKPDELLYSELYAYAEKMADMPLLINHGWTITEDDGRELVIFAIDDPNSKVSKKLRVGEGQFFYNNRFKLEEIVGEYSAYRVRYLDVENHVFTVESVRPGGEDLPDAL